MSELKFEKAVQMLAQLNNLTLAACGAPSRQALIFTMLNDTIKLIVYDRAILWDITGTHSKLLGISGQSTIDLQSDLAICWEGVFSDFKTIEITQILSADSFVEGTYWHQLINDPKKPSFLWTFMRTKEGTALGLCFERWDEKPWVTEELDLVRFLVKSYVTAWDGFDARFSLRHLIKHRKHAVIAGVLIVLSLFVIHIPMRVVAPCEIVPQTPFVVTAPIDGIISEVVVKPGQIVDKNAVLFVYDKRVVEQTLESARKQVDIIRSEYEKSINDVFMYKPNAFAEMAVLKLQMAKEQLHLDLAEYYASQLETKAPESGIVLMDNPDAWRGRPVKIGEKILTLTAPGKTKVRLELQEDDNILLNPAILTHIFLNIRPESTLLAKITYIASESHVNEHGVTVFTAEAEWVDLPPNADTTLGLKGSAVVYGESVSLFYWIFRRPWAATRHYLGV